MTERAVEDDALQAVVRLHQTAHMTLARAGEHLARQREHARRQAEQQSLKAVQDHEARMRAEWAADQAILQRTQHGAWWDTASGEDVANAYERAASWQSYTPQAAQAVDHIRQEVKVRYGLDLGSTDAITREDLISAVRGETRDTTTQQTRGREEAEAAAAFSRDEAQEASQDSEPSSPEAEQDGSTTAAAREGTGDAPVQWDSPERRAQMRSRVAQVADEAAVDAVMLTDTGHSEPLKGVVPPQGRPAARVNRGQELGTERGIQGPSL